jgi:hypothetical protein
MDITSHGGKTDDLKYDKILSCQYTTCYQNKHKNCKFNNISAIIILPTAIYTNADDNLNIQFPNKSNKNNTWIMH